MNPGDLEDAALAKRQGLEAYEPAPTQEESSLSASGPEGHVGSAQSPEGGLSTATDAGQSPDRSASTCPTCGTRVKVVGRTTKHYEAIAEARADRYEKALRRIADSDHNPAFPSDPSGTFRDCARTALKGEDDE